MSKEDVLKVIGNRFFVWFLTLALLIMGMTLCIKSDYDGFLSERIIGGVVMSPLAIPLVTVFKNKASALQHAYKLDRRRLKNENKQNIRNYKLEKLRIKHSK